MAEIETFIWDEEHECMGEDERRELVGKRLVDCVKRTYENAPYYKKKLDKAGVSPDDIKGIDDITKLPFTDKLDFRDNYPFGTLAVPRDQLVRFHASSGTTGKMKVVGYTANDVELWSDALCRSFAMGGMKKGDLVHIAYGYGLFTGGLGPHFACQKFGSVAIPVSGGNTARQIQILTEWKPEVICCTPTYMLHIIDTIEKNNVDKSELNLRSGFFGAEAWTSEMKDQIESRIGLKAFDIYGLTEIVGPGVGCSCQACVDQIHIQSDLFWPEIVDPETGDPLPEGELGELVFSSVMKEGVPMIRYNTHDLARIHYGKCACGRTTPRIDKITGRADDMLIIRGVNVFPTQIEAAVMKYKEVLPHYMIYVDRINNLDVITVKIELNPTTFPDTMKGLEKLTKSIEGDIASITGIHAKVQLVEPRSLPRSEGKMVRVIDSRFKK